MRSPSRSFCRRHLSRCNRHQRWKCALFFVPFNPQVKVFDIDHYAPIGLDLWEGVFGQQASYGLWCPAYVDCCLFDGQQPGLLLALG